MKFFVNKDEIVDMPIYVWSDEKQDVMASHKISEVPDMVKYETILMKIRRPSYGDSKLIMSISRTDDGVDALVLHDQILRTLLVNWELRENNSLVEYSVDKIDKLSPSIARAASIGILDSFTI